MSDRELEKLGKLGLSSLQSRVYTELLRNGRCRARVISSTLGIARPEAYRILRELSTKGLVQRSLSSPSTFMAISPHIAVTTLIDELRERLRDVEKTRTDLISSLQRCVSHTSQVDNRDQGFNVIIGYANAIARIRQMILDAKKEYVSIFSRYGLARLAQKDDSLRTAIGLANRRNVAIRVISEADESNIVGVNFLSGKAGFRSSHDIRFYVDIVDKREMVFGPVMGESMQNHREADLWTTNRDFISSMYALFEELWKTSKRTARSDFRQS